MLYLIFEIHIFYITIFVSLSLAEFLFVINFSNMGKACQKTLAMRVIDDGISF
jgi:hypothetical protein